MSYAELPSLPNWLAEMVILIESGMISDPAASSSLLMSCLRLITVRWRLFVAAGLI
ncbi:hypothetical protein SynBIOSE41_03852 [Synechococcus sp. BIOS-E4-1]|nr:hypothetical protein SynBIOSE41_03852 [Synechococcus sp. BIOS-E4-1]